MGIIELSIAGLFLCALTGLVLGMVGGGGAILMVPILHYVVGFSASEATMLSMAIVGSTAFVGGLVYFRNREVDVKTGLLFAAPSLVAVSLVRIFLLPAIPTTLFVGSPFELTKDKAILLFFSIVMVFVALAMLRANSSVAKNEIQSPLKIVRSSVAVGLLTGFVGAGGGFLIVPALHLLLSIPMRIAVGTSLFVIFINSLVGFSSEIFKGTYIPWATLTYIISSSVFGMFVGLSVAKKVPQSTLKKGFAFLILAIAILILTKEIL